MCCPQEQGPTVDVILIISHNHILLSTHLFAVQCKLHILYPSPQPPLVPKYI